MNMWLDTNGVCYYTSFL